MSRESAKRPGVRLARPSLLLIFMAIALIALAAAVPVTITKANVAAYGGSLTTPYFENQAPPVTGCTSPCLSVDTQTAEPSSTRTALALDGSAIGNWTTGASFSVNASTTATNDVIVLWIVTYLSGSSIPVSSVSDSSEAVAWQSSARAAYSACTKTQETTQTEWYGIASTALSSDVITVSLRGTPTAASALEFAVSGANTVTPFDPNASVPAILTCSTTSAIPTVTGLSTTDAHDLVFAVYAGYNSKTETAGAIAGTTSTLMQAYAATGDSLAGEYTIASSPLSSQPCVFGSSTRYWGIVCDAIVQGGNTFTLQAGSSMYLWSPQFGTSTNLPAGSLSVQLFADLPAPSLDGSGSGSWSSGTTMNVSSFSTTRPNEVVVLSIQTYKSSTSIGVTSVYDSQSEITWQTSPRASLPSCSGTRLTTKIEWYGVAQTVVVSDTILVTLSTTPTSASVIAFGVAGADTTTPFDPATTPPLTALSSCTGTASTPAISGISTAGDTGFVFAAYGSYPSKTEKAGAIGALAGTLIGTVAGTGDSNAVEYVPVASSLAGSICSFGATATYWGGICDALIPMRQTVTVSYLSTDSSGSVASPMVTGSPATITALYQPILLSSSSGSVPSSGYLRVMITAPDGTPLFVFWGSPRPTLFEVQSTVRTQ